MEGKCDRSKNTASTDDSIDSNPYPIDPEMTVGEGHKPFSKQRFMKHGKKTLADPLGIRPHFKAYHVTQAVHDAIDDVNEGDKTELNAWQWRHAPFFNRIKASIAKMWTPGKQIRDQDPQGTLLGHKDLVTVLEVTLDRQGQISQVYISSPSGVAYLDAEAERAFRASAPFSYPPKELFNERGDFSFSFAFHLHIDRGISFDFQWD